MSEYFRHLRQTQKQAAMVTTVQSCSQACDTQFGNAGAYCSRREGEDDVLIAFGTDVTETLMNCETVLNSRRQLAGDTAQFDGKEMVGVETILDVVTLGRSEAA